MTIVAWLGGLTALVGATMGVTQYNLKKVLAYSTMSQIGLMVMACGLGAFSVGMFHLYTHAFFKACLFLGAGAVLHALAGEEDMRRMGGLARRMPFTFGVFLLATLALCGLPPFAGFFSKDEILWSAYASTHGSLALWLVGHGRLVPDRVLHVPRRVHDVLRREPRRRTKWRTTSTSRRHDVRRARRSSRSARSSPASSACRSCGASGSA